MFFGHDQIGAQHQLKTSAASNAVDSSDNRFVEIARVVQSAEPCRAPVLVGLLAGRRGLQIPAGAEELVTCPCDDGKPQLRIGAELLENLVQLAAGGQIDGVGLGPVQPYLKDRSVSCHFYSGGHRLMLLGQPNQGIDRDYSSAEWPDDNRVDVQFG